MTAFVEAYPAEFHPLGDDGTPDTTRTLTACQLRPGEQQQIIDWAGGGEVLPSGAVALPGGRWAPLGDFVVRDGDQLHVEPAAGFWQRHQLADQRTRD